MFAVQIASRGIRFVATCCARWWSRNCFGKHSRNSLYYRSLCCGRGELKEESKIYQNRGCIWSLRVGTGVFNAWLSSTVVPRVNDWDPVAPWKLFINLDFSGTCDFWLFGTKSKWLLESRTPLGKWHMPPFYDLFIGTILQERIDGTKKRKFVHTWHVPVTFQIYANREWSQFHAVFANLWY